MCPLILLLDVPLVTFLCSFDFLFYLCLVFPDYKSYRIEIFEMDFFDWFINSVRPESLFDSGPFILLLLVSNNGIILS